MPGFNICGIGGSLAATIETRRDHRWVFEALGKGGGDLWPTNALLILQSAQRPNFKFEEPEMHHNQEVARFAGKQDWEPITMTWYDAEQSPDVSFHMWDWIQHVSRFDGGNSPGGEGQYGAPFVQIPGYYKREGQLSMLSGVGVPTERWRLCNTWPKENNWGDIDYTSTEIATIEVQMRFDRAMRLQVA